MSHFEEIIMNEQQKNEQGVYPCPACGNADNLRAVVDHSVECNECGFLTTWTFWQVIGARIDKDVDFMILGSDDENP